MNRATRRKAAPPRPLLQTAMAALGGVATLAAVGVIVWEAVQPAAPATLSARIERVETTAHGHVAAIKVVNDGDETAAGVDVEAVAGDQTATATLDYVPGRGHATAYMRFDADPRAAVVTVKGWSAP